MKFKNSIIPTFLASIIVVAGMFAFVPVQDASTVHDAIAGDFIGKVATSGTTAAPQDADVDAADTETLTCTADFRLISLVFDFTDDGAVTGADVYDVTIGDDDTNVASTSLQGNANELLGDGGGGGLIGSGTTERTVTITAKAGDFGDVEILETVRASYISSGTCTWD